MKTKLLITGLAFMALTTLSSAQNSAATQKQQNNVNGKGIAYVDANKNGICDNFENGTSNRQTGIRNYHFRGGVQGPGQGLRQGGGQGHGMGQGQGQGRGRGRNFVDADKNGICDYYEASVKN